MKKFLRLCQNEALKLFHKASFKAIVIVALCLAILMPIAGNLLFSGFKSLWTPAAERARYLANSVACLSEAENTDAVDETYGNEDGYWLLNSEYYKVCADSVGFFIDNGIADSWKYQKYSYEYMEDSLRVKAYELVLSGKYSYYSLYHSEFSGYIFADYGFYTIKEYYDGNKYCEEEIIYEELIPDFSLLLATARSIKENLYDYVLNVKAADIMATTRDEYARLVSYYESKVEELELGAEYNPTDTNVRRSLTQVKDSLFINQQYLFGYNFLIDNGYDFDSWQYTAVSSVLPTVASNYSSYIMSEEEYEEYAKSAYTDVSYADYANEKKLLSERAQHDFEIIRYSLEHNVTLPDTVASYKESWKDNVKSMVNIVSIFLVVIAGGMVSSEFSSGTVRLLIIRPKKRWKILLSKLLTLVAYGILIMLALYLVLFVLNLIFGGVSDMFVPDLAYMFGHVVEIPSFIAVLYTILLEFIPMFLIISLAFMMSTTTRKSSLSIAIPMVAMFMISTVSSVALLMRYREIKFFDYTPFPYMDLSVFNTTICNFWDSNYTPSMILTMPVWLGVIEILLLSALCIFFSFLSFNKQEIKN